MRNTRVRFIQYQLQLLSHELRYMEDANVTMSEYFDEWGMEWRKIKEK